MTKLTPAERKAALALIMAECRNVFSDLIVINTVHDLGFSITEIGHRPLVRAMNEERRLRMAATIERAA